LIDGNTIIDPVGAGIAINIDPPDNINVTIRNITISNNTIIFNRIPTEAIHIGPGNNSVVASGNLYDKITIQTNLIQVAAGAEAQPSESALIYTRQAVVFSLTLVHRLPYFTPSHFQLDSQPTASSI
jgi:hypothetical protein